MIFDNNLPQRRSMYGAEDVEGDVSINEDYYPWVSESFLGGHVKRVILLGRGDVLTYRSVTAKNVSFSPNLHSNEVLYSEGPKVRGGEVPRYIYPDGDVVETRYGPSLRKLKSLSEKIGSQ